VKRLCLIFLIIFLNGIQYTVAQEQENFYEPSWDQYLNNYTQFEKERPKKQVTQEEFDRAIEVINSYQKKDKVTNGRKWWQLWKKEEKSLVRPDTEKKNEIPETPSSPDPLLRLPVDIFNGDLIIRNGFYLISAVKKESKYFLIFKQGNSYVAEVEAKNINKDSDTKSQNTSAEIIDNNFVKIYYHNAEGLFEVSLPILK